MTLLSPTLAVNHLAVYKDGYVVLKVKFHKGLNILRGRNSSGKTTTLDFIAHTLGLNAVSCGTRQSHLTMAGAKG